MKISIITLTYNSEKTIIKTLKSIKKQKNNNIESIIIDGASRDKTLEIIKKYKFRNTILHSKKDKGMYFALNQALKVANGDVIGILHSDDIFYNNNVIKNVLNKFSKTKADIIYGDIQYINKNNHVIRKWLSNNKFFKNKIFKSKNYNDLINFGWMPPHTGLFFKSKIMNNRTYYNTKYKISSDYDFIIRMFKNSKFRIFYYPIFITKMKIGGISNSSIKNIIKKSKEDYDIIKKNKVGGIKTLLLKNFQKIKQFF
jgi:glycosyltransferase